MNNPQLPPIDAPVGEIAYAIAELMRLHPNVHAAVINAVRTLHPLDLHTLEHLQKEFYRFAGEAAEEWQGPDYRSGQARAYERVSAYLLNAIDVAQGNDQ